MRSSCWIHEKKEDRRYLKEDQDDNAKFITNTSLRGNKVQPHRKITKCQSQLHDDFSLAHLDYTVLMKGTYTPPLPPERPSVRILLSI